MHSRVPAPLSRRSTYPASRRKRSGWLSKAHFALDQGPVILMIENYRSGLIWRLMRGCDGTPVTIVTRPPRVGPTSR